MESYRIKLTRYSETGALTNDITVLYANTPEEAKNICNEYDKQKYETVDDQGNTTVGGKIYKVELFVLAYKLTDKDTFFAIFEA